MSSETLAICRRCLFQPQQHSFGHIVDQFTMPVGVLAGLDTERQTLTLLESTVA